MVSFIGLWGSLRLQDVDHDPLKPDPRQVEVTVRGYDNTLKFRLANTYLHRAYRHQRELQDALGIDPQGLKTALQAGADLRTWLKEHRQDYSWLTDHPDRGKLITDDLFQLHRSLEQTTNRIESWQEADFRRLPDGTVQHFRWLRHLLTRRIRLAGEALSYPEIRALDVFFNNETRTAFDAIGLNESLRRFFGLKTPVPFAKSA